MDGSYSPNPRDARQMPARRRAETIALAGGGTRRLNVERRISRPGIYMIPAAAYHADPVIRPSLSHSMARIILDRSLLHARHAHPRLNPNHEPIEPTKPMQHGTVLHKLILGRGEDIEVLPAEDYRKKDTQQARDAAFARGATPVLAHEFAELRRAADAVLAQMRGHPGCAEFFHPGRSEAVAVWRYGPVWCRSMIDRLPDAPGAPIFDIKSTGMSARPADWERSLQRRYATQAAFYRAGVAEASRRPAGEVRFVLFERDPPYAMSVVACEESLVEASEHIIRQAITAWARATMTGQWPGYGTEIHRIVADMKTAIDAEAAQLDFGRIAG